METFRVKNVIDIAYENGDVGLVMDDNPNNPFRLHRFKKKYNANATGKKVGSKYKIVFWDNLKGGNNESTT